ncbi:MAG: class I SAM-dependent methyltransferase [Deltaproteobacteria bacterium]|nr:class I SAM-dependent methyltransferase [Deltaproteobacteria bacterium]
MMKHRGSSIQCKDGAYYRKITYQRWLSYYWQMQLVSSCNPEKVLEIGIGDGIASAIEKKLGHEVITCDILTTLTPDVTADIRHLPFRDTSFDLVACFQVLEHLDYRYFYPCLCSLYKISRKHVALSLPQRRKYLHVSLHSPWMRQGESHHAFRDFPRYQGYEKPSGRSHRWEIDIKEYPLKKIIHDIEKAKFKIIVDTSIPENVYHRFFLLEK